MLTKEQNREKNGASYYSLPGPFAFEDDVVFPMQKMDLPENTLFVIDSVSENRDSNGNLYYYAKIAILGQVGTEKEFRDAGVPFDKDNVLSIVKPVYGKDDDGVIMNVTDITTVPGYVKILSAEELLFASYGYTADNKHGMRKGNTQGISHTFTCILPSPLKKNFACGEFDRSAPPDVVFFMTPQLDRKYNVYMNLEYVTAFIAQPFLNVNLGHLLSCNRESQEYGVVKQAVVSALEAMVIKSNSMMKSRLTSTRYVAPVIYEGSGNRNQSSPYARKQTKF